MEKTLRDFVAEYADEAIALSRVLFHHPELAGEEQTAVQASAALLNQYGFTTEIGAFQTPTCFVSHWGTSTAPVIGFLAEYDALPGLHQPGGSPCYQGNPALPGHGCGHNLLGAACVLAAISLRAFAEAQRLPLQIVLYGCPAEETLTGKIQMARAGAFRELDIALSWHPFDSNRTSNTACQAMDAIAFTFHGKSAHAAAAPHLGRSALDACELMNVGVNYLREHLTDGERIHYGYLNSGSAPNVVPDLASTLYFIRGKHRALVTDTTRRVIEVAKGAALMTETSMDYSFQSRGYEMLVNHTIAAEIHRVMESIPLPVFDDAAMKFARDLALHAGSQPRYATQVDSYTPGETVQAFGSTDFSDVSHLVPSGAFRCVCAPVGTPLHHWAMTACSGSPVGETGMLYAAQVLAETGRRFAADGELLKRAKEEFLHTSHGWWDAL